MRVFLHMLLSFILSTLICIIMFFAHQIWFDNILEISYYNLSLSSIGLYFIIVFVLIFISSFSKYNTLLIFVISLFFILHFATSLESQNVFEYGNAILLKAVWQNLLLKPVFILLLILLFLVNAIICVTFNKIKPRFIDEIA